jgi:hypothetical protein
MYPVSLSKQSSSRIYQDLWATRLHSLVQLASDHSLDTSRTVAMETFKQVYAIFPLTPFFGLLEFVHLTTTYLVSHRFVQPLRVTHANLQRTPKEHHQSPFKSLEFLNRVTPLLTQPPIAQTNHPGLKTACGHRRRRTFRPPVRRYPATTWIPSNSHRGP